MMMPKPPSRSALRTFWALLSLTLAVALGTLLALLDLFSSREALSAGIAFLLLLATPGMARPYAVALPYRAWNWLGSRVAAALRTYVTAVCFLTVIVPASRGATAPHFVAASSSGSMWTPRGTQPSTTYQSQYHDSHVESSSGRPIAAVCRWARFSGNYWAWALVPFLLLLRVFDTSQDAPSAPTSDIYTLY